MLELWRLNGVDLKHSPLLERLGFPLGVLFASASGAEPIPKDGEYSLVVQVLRFDASVMRVWPCPLGLWPSLRLIDATDDFPVFALAMRKAWRTVQSGEADEVFPVGNVAVLVPSSLGPPGQMACDFPAESPAAVLHLSFARALSVASPRPSSPDLPVGVHSDCLARFPAAGSSGKAAEGHLLGLSTGQAVE
ncbi:hypothetical protein M8818_002540 [Zalaria obscura]|uniref:Uncharacterized protein n=1 Tax=Zalaria obscura TaxID=2024903 RepID=A0ACC3SG75_9PEZI